MFIYYNTRADSPLRSVEFEPSPNGNTAFITLADEADRNVIESWLSAPDIHQTITAETTVTGQHVLVSHGPLSEDELLQKFADHGDMLTMPVTKTPINWWSHRGTMGMIGQTLQLISSFTRVEQTTDAHRLLNSANAHFNPKLQPGMWVRRGFDPSIGLFAILNLTANFGNMIYGGQKESDPHHLRYIKNLINEQLAPNLRPNEMPLDIEDTRKALRAAPPPKLSITERFNDFARRNSVRFFELGLRSIAAAALVIPFSPTTLKQGASLLKSGKPLEAFNVAKNPNSWVRTAGFAYLTGKALAWFTKVPDPYDPKPHTALDTIREKVLFPTGSVIECVAGATVATAAYRTQKIGFSSKNRPDIQPHRDWLGATGGGLFATGYVMRLGADFGSRNVDMDEVIAYSSDMLAKTPPDKLPQLMADTAATLTNHFNDPKLSYAVLYQRLSEDWKKYHGGLLPHRYHTEQPTNAPAPQKDMPGEEVALSATELPKTTVEKPISHHPEKLIAANENELAELHNESKHSAEKSADGQHTSKLIAANDDHRHEQRAI